MRAHSDKARKSMRFGFQNRAWERSGEPKSRPDGRVRAAESEKGVRSSAIFLKWVRASLSNEKVRAARRVRAPDLRSPRGLQPRQGPRGGPDRSPSTHQGTPIHFNTTTSFYNYYRDHHFRFTTSLASVPRGTLGVPPGARKGKCV